MDKDLNNASVVTEPDLNNADVVNQQDLTAGAVDQQKQDETLADGTDPNKTVKYSELKKATDAKNEAEAAKTAAEEQAAHAQRQVEILEQQRLVQANPQQPKSSMEQALSDCGVTAEEMYGEAIPRVMARKDEIDRSNQQQQQAVMGVRQFVINHPDINQVVGSVNPATGQIAAPSAEILALVAKKPYLAGATLEMLYDSVLQERKISEFEKGQAAQKEHQNRTDIDNNTSPLGGSAAGSGVNAGDVRQKMMSRDEVLETERKLAAGEL